MRWARRETETTASIVGSAARAFAQPTGCQPVARSLSGPGHSDG
ncbi:MAG: hypothetical protein [Olavius algarvensis Gamma 1 endosymbiont]|nr:MAG: hypothetical protein [Olavius algarvensis Gamma 1 endosymbiont]